MILRRTRDDLAMILQRSCHDLPMILLLLLLGFYLKNTESNSHSVLFPGAVQNYQIYVDNYSYNKNN